MPTLAESINPIDTREELAKIAGVSHGTLAKVKAIEGKATEEIFRAKARENLSLSGGDRKSEEYKSGSPTSAKAIDSIDTREELALIAGVSHDTIAKVRVIEEKATKEQKDKINVGEESINSIYQEIRREKPTWLNVYSSESTEWYTPEVYIEAPREVMGGIDVDPASSEEANKIVKASIYYTKLLYKGREFIKFLRRLAKTPWLFLLTKNYHGMGRIKKAIANRYLLF